MLVVRAADWKPVAAESDRVVHDATIRRRVRFGRRLRHTMMLSAVAGRLAAETGREGE